MKQLRPGKYVECGCCGCFHHEKFFGDCRNDEQRFIIPELENYDGTIINPKTEVVWLDESQKEK